MKHTELPESLSLPTKTKVAKDMLHPLYFKQYVNDAAKKLAGGCYSKKTLSALKGYTVSQLDDANFSYQFFRKVIENFNGNGEKFYPQFYDCVSGDEIVFRGLNKSCSVILGLEVANLTGSRASDTLCSVDIQQLDGKERNIVKYLSDYVFHTLYRCLRKAKYHNESSTLHMSILLAGKSTLPETDSSTDDIFIDAKNRGGLWKVIPQAMKICLVVEKQFREHVGDDTRKIDIKSMVLTLLRNCLSYPML